jgi:hypothetical protein
MTRTVEDFPLAPIEAAPPLRPCRLESLLLGRSSFAVSPTFLNAPDKCELVYGLAGDPDVSADRNEGAETSRVTVVLSWRLQGRSEGKAVLDISAMYILFYEYVTAYWDGPGKSHVQTLAIFASYPYFRHLVSTMSAMSGAAVPLLPVIHDDAVPMYVPATS